MSRQLIGLADPDADIMATEIARLSEPHSTICEHDGARCSVDLHPSTFRRQLLFGPYWPTGLRADRFRRPDAECRRVSGAPEY